MGVKVMSISSSTVFATPTLGLQFWNFRRCWRQPRLKQCTPMQVVYGLLGVSPFFWVLRGDDGG